MFFRYKVTLDISDEKKEDIGIVCGNNLIDAVENLESYYGSEIYDITCLRIIGDNSVLPIKLEYDYVLDEIEKDAIF